MRKTVKKRIAHRPAMVTNGKRIAWLGGAIIIIVSQIVFAEGTRREAATDDGARKAQYMMRQLVQQKSALEAEKVKMAAEITALEKQAATLNKKLEKTQEKLDKSRNSNGRLVTRVKDDHEKIKLLIGKYRDTRDLYRLEKANVAYLKNAVIERNDWIDRCRKNNSELVVVNQELVDKWQNKGFLDTLKQTDSITGIGKVRVEVLAEDYFYRIEDLQVAKFKDQKSDSAAADSHR